MSLRSESGKRWASIFISVWYLCANGCSGDPDQGDVNEEPAPTERDDDEEVDASKPAPGAKDAGAGVDAAKDQSSPDAALDARSEPPSQLGDARTGSAEAGTSTGADGAATADATAQSPVREDLGKGDGKDVVAIGDSWMSLGRTGIQYSMVKLSMQPYRTYGVGGTRLLNGQIPGQYARAKQEDPDIKTVVMTGGGNDILQTNLSQACADGTPACAEQLAKINMALSELWAQMSKDGVMDVIHIMYSSDAGRGVKDPAMRNKDLAETCAKVPPPMRCHLLLTDDLVMGDLRSDDIHPSDAAYDRIGQGVLDLMAEEGMRR